MTIPIAFRASASRPCPVCGTGSKNCSATEDGLHLCRGEPLAGWVRLSKTADAVGFFPCRRADDRGREHVAPAKSAPASPARNWRVDAERFARGLTPDRRTQLADVLGLPESCLSAAPLIGFTDDPHQGECWTFPECDADGRVTAVNRRFVADGSKRVMQGGTRGVYASAGWERGSGPVLVPEGASDMLALAAAGLSAIGRPNDKGGAEIIAAMLRKAARELVVLGENDKKANGHWPGREGAEFVAKKLAALLGRPVKWALPPDGIKDARAWVQHLEHKADGRTDWVAIGREVQEYVLKNGQIVNTPLALYQPDGLIVTPLSTLKARPVRYVVPGRIPRGKLMIIAGRGGGGKSTLARSLIASISVGRCAFGMAYPKPVQGTVLLLAAEDGPADTILPGIAAEGGDVSRVHIIEGVRHQGKRDEFTLRPEHVELLREKLKKTPDVVLIVVDPVASFVGRARVDDHKASELRLVLDPLSALAEETGVTILLLAHVNKASGAAVDRIAGSAAYRDACRAAFLVTEDPDDDTRRLLTPAKNNLLGFDPTALPFGLEPLTDEALARVLAAEQFSELDAEGRDATRQQLRRVKYYPAVTADVEAAMRDPQKRGAKKEDVEGCMRFIREFLGSYAWPDDELESAVKKAGFSFSVLKDAKSKMRGDSKGDPTRLSSKPHGEGGAWWQWIGSHFCRPADRPLSLLTERETGESGETERVERLKTESCAGGAGCDGDRHSQSIQSFSSSSLSVGQGLGAEQRDCPPAGEAGVL